MAAFEKISSGIPEMDKTLDHIRLGDNVVWQVNNLDEFKVFMMPYVTQAIQDSRKIVYIRFASHEPLLESMDGVEIVHVELSHRFETFTVDIHNYIEQYGKDVFYVFDCLSELQVAWSSDLMMGNFFKVTCPYLFELDTVAYFPILRGKHSYKAVARIRDTTQLFLDVYSQDGKVYLHPLKVWNRYSETMFLSHCYLPKEERFWTITDGIEASLFYHLMNQAQSHGDDQNIDSWDRFFTKAKQIESLGLDTTEICRTMCNMMMTRDEKLRGLVQQNFTTEDYLEIRSRMIGTGMIGGKACGMLLARKLIENHRPDIYARLEPHDSFYIGSDVFYSFIVHNGFWNLRVRQHIGKEYFSLAPEMATHFMEGEFSVSEQEQFLRLLDYFGQNPIIVRSSSILEDGFGNAFAGKYESVFCANTGSREERLKDFENAVRVVYASTMSQSALDYRLRRGLGHRDEQMALLVQRVSGSRYGNYFMPGAAGVGYSYSPYRMFKDNDPEAGMLRLVMGLGTGAVDRTEGSYPRLVCLDAPELVSASDIQERFQMSQKSIDLIDTESKAVEHRSLYDVVSLLSEYSKQILLEHDYETEAAFRNRGQRREIMFMTCHGLVKNQQMMKNFKDILRLIQNAYDYPVDIEYTINISKQSSYVINLLQCRPLQVAKENEDIAIPEKVAEDKRKIFMELKGSSMGLSQISDIDYIVMVDGKAYYEMEYNAKSQVAQAIGQVNWHFRNIGKKIMLIVPGRIGTSSPELGVPVTFAEISEFMAIIEVSDSRAGYVPELSYGSHIFQDLVEADILYGAVFESDSTICYNTDLLHKMPEVSAECDIKAPSMNRIIQVYEVANRCKLYHDMRNEHIIITIHE